MKRKFLSYILEGIFVFCDDFFKNDFEISYTFQNYKVHVYKINVLRILLLNMYAKPSDIYK